MTPPAQSDRERILRILRDASTPRRLSEIALSLPRVPKHKIAEELRSLQQQGAARRLSRGWVAVDRPGPSAGIELRPASLPRRESGALQTGSEAPPIAETFSSRWSDFRRLCNYYAECVRLEERPSVRSRAEFEGREFISIRSRVSWSALEAGESLLFTVSPDYKRFAAEGRTGKGFPRLFLGGPAHVYVGKDKESGETYRLVSPALVVQVRVRQEGDQLRIEPVSSAEINQGWLQANVRGTDKQRELLARLGFRDDSDPGASVLEADHEEESLPPVRFEDAFAALWECYRDMWVEYASLDRVDTNPALSELKKTGLYNRIILCRQPDLKYGAGLHRELLAIAKEASDKDLDRSALSLLFPHEPPPEAKAPATPSGDQGADESPACRVAEFAPLNAEQRLVCASVLAHRLVVATGPPGTGKSLVVSHVLANAALRGRPVLFASRNHQAIDAVVPRLNALTEPEKLIFYRGRGLGAPSGARAWSQILDDLLARPARGDRGPSLPDLDRLLENRAQEETVVTQILALRDELARIEEQLAAQVRGVSQQIQDALWANPERPSPPELDHCISALEAPTGRAPLRWIRWVMWRLRLRSALAPASSVAERLRDLRERPSAEAGASPVTAAADLASFLADCRQLAVTAETVRAARDLERRISELPNLTTVIQRLGHLREVIQESTQAALASCTQLREDDLAPTERQRFAEVHAALQNASPSQSIAKAPRRLLVAFSKIFPRLIRGRLLWATTNLSVRSVVPRLPACFDRLVVDEASQCDIASVVPLLFRSRGVVVVGDPLQLQHVSTLRPTVDRELRRRFGLLDLPWERFTFRTNSFFRLAASSERNEHSVRLLQHFRCHPEIAGYSNSTFYEGSLIVMTDVDRLRVPRGYRPGCAWTDVSGSVQAARSGCWNPNEVEAVVAELQRLSRSNFTGSIGVVTPFREQANRVRDRVAEALPAKQLEEWGFDSNTADGFQGGERDVMIFSLVGADGIPAGSQSFLAQQPNRFNVAVSRGRALLHAFGDKRWAAQCGIPHIAKLLRTCEAAQKREGPVRSDLIGPVWEPRLAAALRDAELPIHQQYYACGRFLDFALLREGFKLNVEVDGECHRDSSGGRRLDDVYRDLMLEAAGWTIKRFWVYRLRDEFDDCVNEVIELWRGNGPSDGSSS